MNEDLAFKKPDRVTTEQAATIGVGLIVGFEGNPKIFMSNTRIDSSSRLEHRNQRGTYSS